MSGHKFNPALTYPCYGSVVSHHQGFKSDLPPFVQLGGDVDRRFGGGTSGFLGMEHNPFEMLADPNGEQFTVRDISPPPASSCARVERRRGMLAQIDALQRKSDLQPAAFDALDEHYQAALNMITSPGHEAGVRDRARRPPAARPLRPQRSSARAACWPAG